MRRNIFAYMPRHILSREAAERIARILLQPMIDLGACNEEQVALAACIVESEVTMDQQRQRLARQFKACVIRSPIQ